MIKRGIIVNADDFGLTESITRGIVEGHRKGIITSTSLIPSGQAFDFAVTKLAENPKLGVGVHLTLNEELPLSEPEKIPHLVGQNGLFLPRGKLIRSLVAGLIPAQEIFQEWCLQIERVLACGIKIDHLDSHGHIHLFPTITPIFCDLMEKFRIGICRVPVPRRYGTLLLQPRVFLKKSVIFASGIFARQEIKKRGLTWINCWGLAESGNLDSISFARLLFSHKDGIREFMLHPGFDGSDNARYRYWNYKWEQELMVTLDPELRNQIERHDTVLTNYREVAQQLGV